MQNYKTQATPKLNSRRLSDLSEYRINIITVR